MRLEGIRPGDIVRCSVRGRVFHAVVKGEAAGSAVAALRVDPIERGISHHHVKAREVLEHWARKGRAGGGGTGGAPSGDVHPEQRSLEDLWDR